MAAITGNQLRKLEDAAEQCGGTVVSYSGRGMYGKLCMGVGTDNPNDVLAVVGILGAKSDSMGMGTIVYWPEIQPTPSFLELEAMADAE